MKCRDKVSAYSQEEESDYEPRSKEDTDSAGLLRRSFFVSAKDAGSGNQDRGIGQPETAIG